MLHKKELNNYLFSFLVEDKTSKVFNEGFLENF